jgi:solute carrier family 35 protein E3
MLFLVQGLLLLGIGPFIDMALTGSMITSYHFTLPGGICLLMSCAISVLVNISQFMCLGRFSAVTFQVRGFYIAVHALLSLVCACLICL